MIAQVLTLIYLIVGLTMATFASYMDKSTGSPPEIQGFMVITLFWVVPPLMGLWMAIDQKR